MTERYEITDEQWQKIHSALMVASTVCMMHKREFHQQMLDASFVMDDIINGPPGDLSEDDK